LDRDSNGTAEWFVFCDNGNFTFLRGNGTVECTAAADKNTMVCMIWDKAAFFGSGSFSLFDPETGETFSDFEKVYTNIHTISQDGHGTDLFLAAYDGGIDLLREDGTVVLENIRDLSDRQGDVFFCIEDGKQGLKRMDGSWLYAE
jgi:hypothetical protein